jgi:tetratricopeptide (TPR) repeat protein
MPPLEAYRRDAEHLAAGADTATRAAAWLSAAVMLRRWSESSPTEREQLDAGLRQTLEQTTAPATDRTSNGWIGAAGRRIANEAEEAGAFHLAYSILALTESIQRDDPLERGRSIAQRARIARKVNDREGAEELYRTVEELAREAGSPELRSRAFLGYGVLARVRGNYPDARRWYALAASEADAHGISDVSSMAHHGLMTVAGTAGDFETALLEGWRAFHHTGSDADREAEMLVNLGQLLLEMGRPESAAHALAAAISRTRLPRLLLAGWGGVAVAAAHLGDTRLVDRAAIQIDEIARQQILPHSQAAAHFDLAKAYVQLGRRAPAEKYRQFVLSSAQVHGFHEFAHRAESLADGRHQVLTVKEQALGQPGLEVVECLTQLGDLGTLYALV